jgi:hypothetical protein
MTDREVERGGDMAGRGLIWLLILGVVVVQFAQLLSVWPLPRQQATPERRECK